MLPKMDLTIDNSPIIIHSEEKPYFEQEYSDLSSKYQMVLQMLESEQQQRTLDKDTFLEKEKHMKRELEALRKSHSKLKTEHGKCLSKQRIHNAEMLEKTHEMSELLVQVDHQKTEIGKEYTLKRYDQFTKILAAFGNITQAV